MRRQWPDPERARMQVLRNQYHHAHRQRELHPPEPGPFYMIMKYFTPCPQEPDSFAKAMAALDGALRGLG